jgi:hypothetical protein
LMVSFASGICPSDWVAANIGFNLTVALVAPLASAVSSQGLASGAPSRRLASGAPAG